MDWETFCDKYCPRPTIYWDAENPKDYYADCDLEEKKCPFRHVKIEKIPDLCNHSRHNKALMEANQL